MKQEFFQKFRQPDRHLKPRPFFFIETDVEDLEENEVPREMERSVQKLGYAGFALNAQFMKKGYLSEAYFQMYGAVLEKARQLDIKMCLYDENGCPSGSAYGLLAQRYPEDTVKRLDKIEWTFCGPGQFCQEYTPGGVVMGIAAMNVQSKALVDLTPEYCGQSAQIRHTFPPGTWKIMAFECVKDGSLFVDFLCKSSVEKFIEITHQQYYDRFAPYFGTVIDSAFYDEPAMMGAHQWMPGGRLVTEGRMWTPSFNQRFLQRYHESPSLHYPALWYDIGEKTYESRYKLISLRADLFMEFIGTLAQWCQEHRIALTGHTWEEILINPSSAMGDLMKVFKYQHIPGLDSIMEYGHVSRAIKVISSAACNWDKPLVLSETYGVFNYGENFKFYLYKEAMDQYAKGVNYMVPHAVFLRGDGGGLPPELSYRGPYREEMPRYNDYIGRLNIMLQGGRHVADIAMLYPITDLQAEFDFHEPNSRCDPPYSNYMAISEMLSLEIRQDFTYLHPEVLRERCRIDGRTGELHLDNLHNFEVFRVMILPAMQTIDFHSLMKIREFYDRGGKVIAVGRLPSRWIGEGERPIQIQDVLSGMFDLRSGRVKTNDQGGKSWWLETLDKTLLQECLIKALGQPDVWFASVPELEEGSLSYIHKQKENMEIYFLANSSNTPIDTAVILKEGVNPVCWNPHTGESQPLIWEPVREKEWKGVKILLNLDPIQSVFLVGELPRGGCGNSGSQGKGDEIPFEDIRQ